MEIIREAGKPLKFLFEEDEVRFIYQLTGPGPEGVCGNFSASSLEELETQINKFGQSIDGPVRERIYAGVYVEQYCNDQIQNEIEIKFREVRHFRFISAEKI